LDHERRDERLSARPRSRGGAGQRARLAAALLVVASGSALALPEARLAGQSPATAAKVADAQAKPPAASPSPDDTERRALVLARFETGSISVGELEDVIAGKPAHVRANIAQQGGRERLLNELIAYDLLAQEAERRGYAAHPAVTFEHAKTSAETMSASLIDPAAIPAEKIAAQYEAKRDLWNAPAMRRASAIHVATRAEAQALLTELRGKTRLEFERLARERSQDPETQRQSGELGYFDAKGRRSTAPTAPVVPPEIVSAVNALARVGDITRSPIASGSGFVVLMLTGIQPALLQPLTLVEPEIRERLALALQIEALDRLVAELRAQYTPEVHPELLGAIEPYVQVSSGIPEGFPAAPPDPRQKPKILPPDRY
jgi:peptidyl-prolyl cis-trans isomerase C